MGGNSIMQGDTIYYSMHGQVYNNTYRHIIMSGVCKVRCTQQYGVCGMWYHTLADTLGVLCGIWALYIYLLASLLSSCDITNFVLQVKVDIFFL